MLFAKRNPTAHVRGGKNRQVVWGYRLAPRNTPACGSRHRALPPILPGLTWQGADVIKPWQLLLTPRLTKALHNEWSSATPAKTLTLNTKIMRTPLVNCPLYCLAASAVGFAGIVSAPPAVAQGIQASGGEPTVILGGEFKTTENVQPTEEEPKKAWSVYENVGYTSEYNFRGTNLTPDSDGAIFATANLSFSGENGTLTLGIYGIHQFGTAKADAFSISESGGGGAGVSVNINEGSFETTPGDNDATFTGRVSPLTIQKEFDEVDLYITYVHQLGPLDLTVGNIAFFIDRRAETRVTTTGTLVDEGFPSRVNNTTVIPTVGDEQFDRLFVEVSAPRLIPAYHGISVVPRIRYYQTILNEGDDPVDGRLLSLAQVNIPFPGEGLHNIQITGVKERNDSLGGYLEGRVDAVIPVTDRIRVKPYGIVSYSFHDRSEPYGNEPNQPKYHLFRGQSLVGFNHAQFGVTVPIELWRGSPDFVLTFEPFGAYSYHISDPTGGTDRNEGWGGVQLVLTF
jgi:hypothetical protein